MNDTSSSIKAYARDRYFTDMPPSNVLLRKFQFIRICTKISLNTTVAGIRTLCNNLHLARISSFIQGKEQNSKTAAETTQTNQTRITRGPHVIRRSGRSVLFIGEVQKCSRTNFMKFASYSMHVTRLYYES